jgi:hypothetical protein
LLSHGGQKGFEVRKWYTNKRPFDSKITSSRFGYARVIDCKNKMDHLTKCPHTEAEIDCQIYMNLKMDSDKGILEVTPRMIRLY